MASPLKSKICISSVTNGGIACSNPVITLLDDILPDGVLLNCELDSNNCFEVSVIADDITGLQGLCVPVIIQCKDCGACDPLETEICFCEDNTDCNACQDCIGGFCKDRCPDKLCDGGTCVDCLTGADCPNNEICVAGDCQCPPSLPFKDSFGNCKKCQSDVNCPDCTECVSGDCVPLDCPVGECDPDTRDCVECLSDSTCVTDNGANWCCNNTTNKCGCCSGYTLNVLTGDCEVSDECSKNLDCPECESCVSGTCEPTNCGPNSVCVPGIGCSPICDCDEPDCTNTESVCVQHPTIGGTCYCNNCSNLSCDSCENGCECLDGENCEASACYEDAQNVSLQWIADQTGTPGTSLSSLGITSVEVIAGDLVQGGGGLGSYRDYTIQVAATNTQPGQGQWYYSHTPGSLTAVTALGVTSANVTLSTMDDITFGFYLIYRENGPCYRSIKVPVVLNLEIDNPLQAPEDGWVVLTNQVIKSGGCSYGGNLSTTWKLCAKNAGKFIFNTTTPTDVDGSGLNITFSNPGSSCLLANMSGCGTWSGKMAMVCGDQTVNLNIPEFAVDELCCDPTDINCGGPSGACLTSTEVTLPISIQHYFGSSGLGEAEAVAMVDIFSGSVTFDDVYRIASQMCWSTSDNNTTSPVIPDDSVNSVTSVVGDGNGSPLYYQFTYTEGVCVEVGYDCVIESGCKTYKGRECIDKCSAFDTLIIPQDVFNEDTEQDFYVVPNNNAVNYGGSTVVMTAYGPGASVLGTSQPFIPISGLPAPNPTNIAIAPYFGVISYNALGNGELLLLINKDYVNKITFSVTTPCPSQSERVLSVYGCTNPSSCNYNSNATIDDGSCETIVVGASYLCDGTGLIVTPSGCTSPYAITYSGGGLTDQTYAAGVILPDNTYIIKVVDNNGQSNTQSLNVSCCGSGLAITGVPYSCNASSTETLTFTGNPLDTETVVIGGKTYTFQATLTDVDGNVFIGATASDSLDNLIAAINLDSGAGTLYATSTTANTDVIASAGAGDTMDVTAIVPGTAGDTITTTTTVTGGSWGGATLSGGTQTTMTLQFTGGVTDYTIDVSHVGGTLTTSPATPIVQVGTAPVVFTVNEPVTSNESFTFTVTDANGCEQSYVRSIACCAESCLLGTTQTTALSASLAEVTITDNTTYYTYVIDEAAAGIGELNVIATNLQAADSIVVLNLDHNINPTPVSTELFDTNGLIGTPTVSNLGVLARLEFSVSKSYLIDPSCCETAVDTRISGLADNFVPTTYPNTGQFGRWGNSDSMNVEFNIFSYSIECCAPTI